MSTLSRLEYSFASMMLKSFAAPYACMPLRSNCLPVKALFQSAGAYDSAIDLHARKMSGPLPYHHIQSLHESTCEEHSFDNAAASALCVLT